MTVETLNFLLALGTVLLQAATIGLLAAFFLRSRSAVAAEVSRIARRFGAATGLTLVLLGSVLTLVYSELLGFPPCPLCWWQRVFLYPQTVIFALVRWTGERVVAIYSFALSTLGLGVALYHHALQTLPAGSLPCPADGTVSCAQRYVFEFGYVTFPLMAASLFAFLIALALFTLGHPREDD
ncbi:hypothetical protein COU20_02955 [Candidatus Kaiserbacteria bacterium CG10_big_fil_rev_8_21_14_0_10_59_10]|uniref:Disulfide bond formation protein B n=1 Tax=Candidatus Kaiserbacteria bacterium CG10_big_fil_rev_8_21_14_0_10_59_10 TaxID=1974612 RepID=A0A2H0U7G9_9BACT|nr:MAG: hypothetical protein COU20_02955 [Candidatus Kaiserbacteria bacterium CG10_big_fil_rev_8_21_14_0_10_59_10]